MRAVKKLPKITVINITNNFHKAGVKLSIQRSYNKTTHQLEDMDHQVRIRERSGANINFNQNVENAEKEKDLLVI